MLLGGGDKDPDVADFSCSTSTSNDDNDDNVPLPCAKFRAMARHASCMTIGNIEMGEVAVWASVLNFMECQC